MQFRVLGPLQVSNGAGFVAEVSAAKPRSLLALLLVNAGRVVSADTIVDSLWGESPPASASKLLQVYVSQLRKDLPGIGLVTAAPGYRLDVDDLDSATFEALAVEGAAALRAGNPALAARLLGRGLALWRGSAYADVAQPFAEVEAARLEAVRLDALEGRVEADLGTGAPPGPLVTELRSLVDAHPLRERLWALLMRALVAGQQSAVALEAYAQVRQILVDGLGVEPGPELRRLHEMVLREEVEPARSAPGHTSIPRPATALVGRAAELAQLAAAVVRPEVRFLTVAGPGGAGKTRLALALAERVADEFANGVVFVPLAAVEDPELVPTAVARALDVREEGRAGLLPALREALAPLELLLVLDNLEQVVEAAPFLAELLEAAPRLTIVATSRALLRLSGEQVMPLEGLSEQDAATLFCERAAAVRTGFTLTADNADVVRSICTRLDRLPLAIELAAAGVRLLTPQEVRDRLDEHLDVLGSGARDRPERHQTLRAALAWSYHLLRPQERVALDRFSVFAGPCDLQAAQAVTGEGLDVLGALADHSLLRVVHNGEARFSMLATTRAFAAEQLEAGGQSELAHRAHALHYLALAEDMEARLTGPDQAGALAVLESEHDDLRAALDWCARAGESELELRLAAALGRFWYIHGHLRHGRERLVAALSRAPDAPAALRARAARSTSALALIQGDYAAARELAELALELCRQLGDDVGVVRALSNLGATLLAEGDLGRAKDVLDETVHRARGLPEPRLLALALNNRGDAALTEGEYERAVTCFEESLGLLRSLGDSANIARSLLNLGSSALELGLHDQARAYLVESLERSRDVRDREDLAWSMVAIAALSARTSSAELAAYLLGAAERLLTDLDALLKPYERGLFARTESAAREALGESEYAACKWSGQRATTQEAALRAAQPA